MANDGFVFGGKFKVKIKDANGNTDLGWLGVANDGWCWIKPNEADACVFEEVQDSSGRLVWKSNDKYLSVSGSPISKDWVGFYPTSSEGATWSRQSNDTLRYTWSNWVPELLSYGRDQRICVGTASDKNLARVDLVAVGAE